MKCSICEYNWEPRVDEPKACPECKGRLGRQKQETNQENAIN